MKLERFKDIKRNPYRRLEGGHKLSSEHAQSGFKPRNHHNWFLQQEQLLVTQTWSLHKVLWAMLNCQNKGTCVYQINISVLSTCEHCRGRGRQLPWPIFTPCPSVDTGVDIEYAAPSSLCCSSSLFLPGGVTRPILAEGMSRIEVCNLSTAPLTVKEQTNYLFLLSPSPGL